MTNWFIGFYLGIGDIVCAHGALSEVARVHPDATIHVAVGGAACHAAKLMSWPVNVEFLEFVRPRWHQFRGTTSFLAKLWGIRYERMFNSPHPQRTEASWKIPILLGVLRLIGVGRSVEGASDDPFSWMYTCRYPVSRQVPLSRRDATFLQSAGVLAFTYDQLPPFTVDVNPRNAVGIHVGASVASKRWPVEHVRRLCNLIARRWPRVGIELFGLPAELAPIRKMGVPGQSVLFEGTFKETLERVAGLRAIVTMDSGFMHIAAALGLPQVALFGPSSVGPHRPNNARCIIVQADSLDGQVSNDLTPSDARKRSMDRIEPETVLLAIKRVLQMRDSTAWPDSSQLSASLRGAS